MFPAKADLLQNMTGLLGNVAEVPQLRPRLMTKEFVEEVADLLVPRQEGMEVSHNAAGVLAHLASDGAAAWTIKEPDREDVLERLGRAITRWDIGASRNITYRSFAPLLSLARLSSTPQCQMWAVWALANLTSVTPEKHCSLLLQEGGLALMEDLLQQNCEEVRDWAGLVKNNLLHSQQQSGQSGTEEIRAINRMQQLLGDIINRVQ